MSNLQFQSFTNQNFDMSDESPGRIGDGSQEDAPTAAAGPKKNFFSFGFYQQYFDVDTEQVTKRIVNSVMPTHKNYITEFVQPLPDLYGPFWISCTLVFSIGIFSNIAQYIENKGGVGEYGSDFRMVTGASSLIASYVLIVPFIISTTLWYRKADIQYSFLEVVCAYGYSLAIFIPVSMLWVIDINALRWGLIFVSVALSGGVLVRSLAPAFANDPNKLIALGSVIVVLVLHFGLALCFKEYFFDAAMPSKGVVPVAPPAAPVTVPGDKLPAAVTAATAAAAAAAKNDTPVAAAQLAAPLKETVAGNSTTTVAAPAVVVVPAGNGTSTAANKGTAVDAPAKMDKRDNSTQAEGEKKKDEKEAPAAAAAVPVPSAAPAAASNATTEEKAEEKKEQVTVAPTVPAEKKETTVVESTVAAKNNSTL